MEVQILDTTPNKRIPFGIYESEFDANYYVILIKSMYFKEFALPYSLME
jgi:hypothetical protein